MITLKLNRYSQKEVDELVNLLEKIQPRLNTHCHAAETCLECDFRHLCADINQATIYAEDYVADY